MFCLESEVKNGSFLKLRHKVNDSIEVLYDHLADHKAKADTFSVNFLLLIFQGSKQFEDILVVLLLDSLPVVLNQYLNVIFLIFRWLLSGKTANVFNKYVDLTILLGEFE